MDSSVLDMCDYRLLYMVFHVVAMCSTFANPLLYGWVNRNCRGAFFAIFKCHQDGQRGRIGQLERIHPVGGGRRKEGEQAKKVVLETPLNATDV